ncbi:MAG: class I SAM-dependent methyltransferase [Alphaproteobacteria bacterium]|nr:class I SAM-dependent methyltransferase [Alphaproteobacteria bacterium]
MPEPNAPTQADVDFGYRRVSPEEKDRLVRDVFDRVAPRYDLMNDLMSGGLHRIWKDNFVANLFPSPPASLVDVAGGTGDIALRVRREAARRGASPPPAITIVDPNPAMLAIGRDRAIDHGILDVERCLCARAETLPLPDRSYAAYTIAFGMRNVTDIPAALAEARRVLKPGGRFLCLEFSHANDFLRRLYDAYSFHVVPAIGRLVVGDAEPYRYLVESIRRFPDRAHFANLIEQAGLVRVHSYALSGGIVAVHSAWRI